MLNDVIPKWLLGAWFAAVAVVASSLSMGARLSTSVLLDNRS